MSERKHTRRGSKAALIAGLGIAVTLTISACGSSGSGGGSSTTTQTTTPAAASAPTTTSPTTTTTQTTSDSGLSGKWSGKYGGAYSGTFTLNWDQSGSTLSGTIKLSSAGTSDVHGKVDGSSIKFGTVGGPGITYTGSVSGDSMSGSYSTAGGGGTWSATKAS
jgi:hypothetical protein